MAERTLNLAETVFRGALGAHMILFAREGPMSSGADAEGAARGHSSGHLAEDTIVVLLQRSQDIFR